MNADQDGGPAFPHSPSWGWDEKLKRYEAVGFPGMSIKTWLTGKALEGFCSNPAVFAANGMTGWGLVNANEDALAEYCVRLADATLAALGGAK